MHCVVATTTDSAEAAGELARSAVEARLAACAQVVGPISSVYRWRGRVETAREWQVLFKTTRYDDLAAHIGERHSYDLPEVVATPIVAGTAPYLNWIAEETTG